jgi:isopenicillin-N epimerase
VLEEQSRLRRHLEREPVRFFVREHEALLDAARATLAEFVGAHPDDVVFVPNATTGVNTVLRALRLGPGDELLTTNHEYNACRNAIDVVAASSGACPVAVSIPFPIGAQERAVEAVLDRVTPRTRLALIDHVTSQTGLVLPIRRIVGELAARGVETLVDGAHAPGMVAVNIAEIGPAYYTGNCHKWLCAPKGAGFLYVRSDLQPAVRPLTISHGANSPRTDRSRFQLEFGWTGTDDPTAALSVPAAIRLLGSLLPGGWPAVRARNRSLVLDGRRVLCGALHTDLPAPEEMIGSLASVPLPDGPAEYRVTAHQTDPLQDALLDEHGIEVPVILWPAPPKRLIRISAQLYNRRGQYERLAAALGTLLERRSGAGRL